MSQAEFLALYGEVYVMFSHYYKYTFSYMATLEDGTVVEVGVGGDADSIYRMSVTNDIPVRVNELMPFSGTVHRNEKCIAEFYEY